MSRMLLGETQQDLANAMEDYLALNNYTVQTENSGHRILESLSQNQYDVIMMEIALPGIDGISIVRGYRAVRGTAPIILMASSHSSEELKLGLDAGADAYLVKPFSLSDLEAQLRALMRRPSMRSEKILISGNVAIDTQAGTVKKNDDIVHLHPMEFKLLQFLFRHPNQVFSTHALFERVWQKQAGQLEDTVRTHIRTLRQKLDTDNNNSIIKTVRGLGYKTE